MRADRRFLQRVARWALVRFHADGTPLYSDLIEAYDSRRRTYEGLRNDVWFVREVVLACMWGLYDSWSDRRVARGLRARSVSPKQAFRTLRRRPGYSLTVIVLVGIASGAVGGLLGIVRVVASPGQSETADVHVIVGTDTERGWPSAYLSIPETRDLAEGVEGLEDLGVFLPTATLGMGGADSNHPVSVVLADANYFRIMGARTRVGRNFTDEEAAGRAGAVAILSNGLWREQFGSDPAVVGTRLDIAGRSYEVVGVMEADFLDATRAVPTDVWLPLGEVQVYHGANIQTSRPYRWMLAVAVITPERLVPTRNGADRLATDLQARYPVLERGRGFVIQDLDEWWVGRVDRPLRIMVAAALGLLALVFGNLAVLFHVRGQERAPEMALRAALGARKGALRAVVLTEAVLLAVASGGLGVVVAVAFLEWGRAGILFGLPYFVVPRADLAAVVACSLALVPLALIFGPRSGKGRIGVRRRPARWLLAVEAALAALLVTTAGALVRDAREVARTQTGFESPGLLTARLSLSEATTDPAAVWAAAARRMTFAREFVEQAGTISGVESAALVGPSLLGKARWHLSVIPEGLDPWENATRWFAQQIITTPGALSTLGISLLRGRDIDWSDRNASFPAAVVDERIARRFWPDQDPIGHRFCGDGACRQQYVIVGIAEAAKHRGRIAPDAGVVGDVYVSYLLYPRASATLAVRTDGTAIDIQRDLLELVTRLEPMSVVSDVQWMDDRLHADEFVQRMTASLVAICAAAAALLALVGTHGLVAFHIGRRWRDIALRMALGARPVELARAVLAEAILPIVAGAVAGAAAGQLWIPDATAAVSRVAGIGGWGWLDSTFALGILVAAGGGAALIPIMRLRVMRPMEALRSD